MITKTARLICARRALATKQKSQIINDPYAHLFTDESSRIRAKESDAPVHGVLLRNRFYEDLLRQSSPQQVLNMGSGLDTNYQRYAPLQKIPYFEVDLPEMLQFKRETLQKESLPLPAFIEKKIESIEDFKSILQELDPNLKTTFLAEGLFMYLEQELVWNILRSLCSYLKNPPIIGFDFLDAHLENDPDHKERRKLIASKGEFFKWYAHETDIEKVMRKLGHQEPEFWDRERMCEYYTKTSFSGKPFGTIACISNPVGKKNL